MFEFFEKLGLFSDLKSKFEGMLEDFQERIRKAIERAIKRAIIFLLIIIGFIFALVGFARYLTETVPSLDHGMGFVVVGLVLIFLAIIARVFSN